MTKHLVKGAAALTLALAAVSCSNNADLAMSLEEQKTAQYEAAFVQAFGKIDKNQDWGFGSTTKGLTRAAATWTVDHDDHIDGCTDWEDELDFTLPAGAVRIDTDDNIGKTWDGKIDYDYLGRTYYKIPSGNVLYISDEFEGDLVLSESLNGPITIYNYGKVTNISVNSVNGTITYYNAGTLAFALTSGTHIFYNGADGELTLNDYANVGHVYNDGELYLAKTDLRNDLTVHSAGLGIVYFPNGAASGDGLQSTLDIHGKAVVDGDMKIGNNKTQYICHLEVDGTLNLTKGNLQTGYLEADEITFDGDRLHLLPGGHVVVNTMKMPNSATYVNASKGSNALIEVEDIYMQNTNNFEDSFDDNIYFNITGKIDFSNSTLFGGGGKTYSNVAAYVADKGNLSDNRLDGGNATGTPACGDTWTVGTPVQGGQLKDSGRIFCEDMGSIGDFDFNDVVFDAYLYDNRVEITILAAGGTLPMSVAGRDVHAAAPLGLGAGMVNTGDGATAEPVSFTVYFDETTKYETLNEIPVVVSMTVNADWDEKILLKAEQGLAPQKICVPVGTPWAVEYQSIELAYPGFQAWVSGGAEPWDNPNSDTQYIYNAE